MKLTLNDGSFFYCYRVRLEIDSEAHRNLRKKLERGQIMIDLLLLRLNARLYTGISRRIRTGPRCRVARGTLQVQPYRWRALIFPADLEVEAEMPSVPRQHVSKPDQNLRRGLRKRQLSRAGDRVRTRRIAFVLCSAECKRLPRGHGRISRHFVSVVEQHARAQVERTQGIPVQMGLTGAKTQLPVIVDTVVVEVAVVIQKIESAAQIDSVRKRGRRLDTDSQQRNLYANANLRGAIPVWRWRCRRRRP